jgi:hypothetical protein
LEEKNKKIYTTFCVAFMNAESGPQNMVVPSGDVAFSGYLADLYLVPQGVVRMVRRARALWFNS